MCIEMVLALMKHLHTIVGSARQIVLVLPLVQIQKYTRPRIRHAIDFGGEGGPQVSTR